MPLPMHRRNTRRRLLITLGAGVLATPLGSFSQQQGKVWRIGFLSQRRRDALAAEYYEPFQRGLRELGYAEGKNLVVEWRYAGGNDERLAGLATELVRLNVDVIVTAGSQATRASQKATATIPIVMANTANPVDSGFVQSLARPGGNITGMTNLLEGFSGKHLELLLGVVPKLSRLAVLLNPTNSSHSGISKSIHIATKKTNIKIVAIEARTIQEIESAFPRMVQENVGALILVSDALFNQHAGQIAELAVKNRLPSIATNRQYAKAGSLMTYGPDPAENYRRAATYVDRILKGAKPSDLPVEQPTKIHLAINRRTAKALGITVSKELLFRADEVID